MPLLDDENGGSLIDRLKEQDTTLVSMAMGKWTDAHKPCLSVLLIFDGMD